MGAAGTVLIATGVSANDGDKEQQGDNQSGDNQSGDTGGAGD